jgi:GntR family transcriptional regulator / MocR family aminotransferase
MPIATLNMVRLDRRQRESLQKQLYRQIRELIMTGQLEAGVRLPSTRDLVSQLGASRNTIVYAFDQLVAEGYLDSRAGSGMYIAALKMTRKAGISNDSASAVRTIAPSRISNRAALLSEVHIGPEYPTPRVRPFRPCQAAIEHFPLRSWNRARSYALRAQSKELMFEADSAGSPRLRRALATYLRDARGVRCDADQIIIAAGAQQALSLIGTSLIDRGDPVWIEDPGYLGARAALLRAGAKLVPISIDSEGLTIPSSRRTRLPRLIYTTPSRQFPLGTTMTLPRRLALLEFARTSGAWIIEDDYDSEFRYVGRPVPSLQGLGSHDSVIYVGSFSKVLFASLRLGYVVVPHHLVDVFRKAKEIQDGSSSAIDQATAAVFIEEGFFSTHVRRMRKLYRGRLDVFLHEAKKHLSGFLTFTSIDAGMDAMGWLPRDMSDVAISKRLSAAGIDAPPLSAYSMRVCAPGLVFGFTAFSPSEIRLAIEKISQDKNIFDSA